MFGGCSGSLVGRVVAIDTSGSLFESHHQHLMKISQSRGRDRPMIKNMVNGSLQPAMILPQIFVVCFAKPNSGQRLVIFWITN